MPELPDFSTVATIVLMASTTYLSRILGYVLLRNRTLSPRMASVMENVPGCVLISVIAPAFVSTRPADLLALGLATFKTARTLSHDRVASFVREPFVEEEALDGGEHPAGTGMRRALGELVTCTRCIGTWAAAGLASVQILAPRFGRLLTWSLGAAAANDFLQAGFTALSDRAN